MPSSEDADPGFSVPNVWALDQDLVQTVKAAVVTLRKENEWAPRKRGPNLAFRASELGDILAFRDAKGEPGGCARKVFYSFLPEKFAPREFDAETLLNFDKGNEGESALADYLKRSGLLVEGQLNLGAWGSQGDPRYPDRSGGLARGKCDFVINHPKYGVMPLEWKTGSQYVADMVARGGPKPENAIQALFYAHEMGTAYGALGYTNKESGDFEIYVAPAQPLLMAVVFERARWLRARILAGERPPMPRGVRPAQAVPDERWGGKGQPKLPGDAYYDRVWPCYAYAAKKKRVNVCAYYTYCHGALPVKPEEQRPNPLLKGKKKRAAAESSNFQFSS